MMKRFVLSIPDELYDQLKQAAEDSERSMADEARRAIYEWLNAPALTTPLTAGKDTIPQRGGKRAGAGRPPRGSKP
jgi:CopG-like RHH_1 or ribbon-helix-helix domain, RHH_5